MKQVNFDVLRQIKAPEELIDRTIRAAVSGAAPLQTDDEPAVMSVFFRWRRLAVAAGVLLVIGVSIFVYFQIRNINKVPVPVAPATEGTTTDATAPIPTGSSTSPTEPDASVSPSGHPNEPATVVSSGEPTMPTVPTTPPATGPAVVPTQPAVIPTDPTVLSSEPPATSVSTDPPVVEPTENEWPEPTEPSKPYEPIEPWEPPSEPIDKPSESPSETNLEPPVSYVTLRAVLDRSLLTGSGKVYCVIYETDGHDLIFPPHEAHIVERVGDSVTAEYEVQRSWFPAWKKYRVVFCNEDGETVKAYDRYLP